MRKIYSTVSETGTDDNGNYWRASYSRSRNNDILDNFHLDFYEADANNDSAHMQCVSIKLGTITNMNKVLCDDNIANIDDKYEHLIGEALAGLQRIFNASRCLL